MIRKKIKAALKINAEGIRGVELIVLGMLSFIDWCM